MCHFNQICNYLFNPFLTKLKSFYAFSLLSVCAHSNCRKYSSSVLKSIYDFQVYYGMARIQNGVYWFNDSCTEICKKNRVNCDQWVNILKAFYHVFIALNITKLALVIQVCKWKWCIEDYRLVYGEKKIIPICYNQSAIIFKCAIWQCCTKCNETDMGHSNVEKNICYNKS